MLVNWKTLSLKKILKVTAIAVWTVLQSWVGAPVYACGLDWSLPTNHFDGVDSHGHVSYWEKIGEVDCGDGLDLPLYINFNSKRDTATPSPYLGEGWILPLLESKFIQESEDRFTMIQPDGVNNLFIRLEKNSKVLNGSAGWKGEINGEIINAWAPCGWKISFLNGHISSMSVPDGRRLDWVYENGRIDEVREGNTTHLKVQYAPSGLANSLILSGGKSIFIKQEMKPRVQKVTGKNVVIGTDMSLSSLIFSNGQTRSFTFGVNEQILPTLKFNTAYGETGQLRQVCWDPSTKQIYIDTDWTYRITPVTDPYESAAIERFNVNGQNEYWFRDAAKGIETSRSVDGIEHVKSWYVSGVAAGSPKEVYTIENNRRTLLYKCYYDDEGRRLREIAPNSEVRYVNGNIYQILRNKVLLWQIERDDKGHVKSIKTSKDQLQDAHLPQS